MRGFGGEVKKRYLRELFVEKLVEFVGLLETMKQSFSRTDLHNICAGRDFRWQHTPARVGSRGLFLGVNHK
jgi:hypothetical protein